MTIKANFRRQLRLAAKAKKGKQSPESAKNHSSGLDRVSSLASQWAQVLTLALLVFGYFYTVRPVYQKEVLEEESAKLRIENSHIKREVAASIRRVSVIQDEMRQLENNRRELLSNSTAIQNQNRLLSSQQATLQQEANEASGRLVNLQQLTNSQIEEAQTTLLQSRFSLHFWSEIDAFSRAFLEAKPQELEEWFKGRQEQPADIISKKIDEELSKETYFGLPEPHSISRKIVQKIKIGVAAHRADLTCPEIDRDQWSRAWHAASSTYARSIDDCVHFHMQHTINSEGWTEKQGVGWLKSNQGQSFKKSFRATCEVSAGYRQNRLFHERLSEYDRACRARLIYADNIALGNKVDLDPFPSLLPPTPDPRWFGDWYKSGADE